MRRSPLSPHAPPVTSTSTRDVHNRPSPRHLSHQSPRQSTTSSPRSCHHPPPLVAFVCVAPRGSTNDNNGQHHHLHTQASDIRADTDAAARVTRGMPAPREDRSRSLHVKVQPDRHQTPPAPPGTQLCPLHCKNYLPDCRIRRNRLPAGNKSSTKQPPCCAVDSPTMSHRWP